MSQPAIGMNTAGPARSPSSTASCRRKIEAGATGSTCAFLISVDDLDTYRKKVVAAGGNIHVEKRAVPGMGSFSLFTDPEGRMMGLWKVAPGK